MAQPASKPFELLGLEPSFELDPKDLADRHRELSLALHPDRYAGRPAGERRAALNRSIEVNEAYRCLRDPVKRAEALVAHLGVAAPEGQEPPADQTLLMEIMELREALRDAGRSGDADRVEKLRADVEASEKKILDQLHHAFSGALADARAGKPPADPSGGTLLRPLGVLRYYRRFLDEADAILDELV